MTDAIYTIYTVDMSMPNIQEILRRKGLRIDRPEEQEALTLSIPEGDIPSDYENSYKLDYKVRCAFCRNRTPHQWGVTAIMDDGRRALCGNCCAKRVFGDEIHAQLKSELERRENAVVNRELISPLLDGIDDVIKKIKPLLPLERYACEQLTAIVGILPNSWQRKMNDSGRLTVHEDDGLFIGSIKGMDALTATERHLFQAGSELYGIRKMLSDDPDDAVIKAAGLKRQSAVRSIKEGISFLGDARTLFESDENFQLLCIWFKNQQNEYSRKRMKFIRLEPGTYTEGDWTYTVDVVTRELGILNEEREFSSIRLLDGSDFDDLPSSDELINPLRRK